MKPMTCGKCQELFKNHDVKEQKFNFYGYDMRCPNCGTWLAPDSRSIMLRMIGFVLWVSCLAIVYFMEAQSQTLVLIAGFFSLAGMALFAASYKASTLTEKKV
jgi:CXXC-20-CXXC protein